MIYSLHYNLNEKSNNTKQTHQETYKQPLQISIKEYSNINKLNYNDVINYINDNDLIDEEIKSPLKKVDFKVLEEVKRELN